MAISRTSFSTGDIPTTAEWNTQFDTAYNQINAWINGTDAINVTTATVTQLDADNIRIDANTISSTNTNGDITLTPNGTGNIVGTNSDMREYTVSGITASTTQTQGQGALTGALNEVSTVANTDDTVTLPSAVTGRVVTVINNGANDLQIFPASGDDLGEGADTAYSFEPTTVVTFKAYDGTNWEIESWESGWNTWTPSYGAGGSMTWTSITTHFARYKKEGKKVTYEIKATGTTGGSASNTLTFTLPVAPSSTNGSWNGAWRDGNASVPSRAVFGYHTSGSSVSVTETQNSNWNLGTDRGFSISGTYEIS